MRSFDVGDVSIENFGLTLVMRRLYASIISNIVSESLYKIEQETLQISDHMTFRTINKYSWFLMGRTSAPVVYIQ